MKKSRQLRKNDITLKTAEIVLRSTSDGMPSIPCDQIVDELVGPDGLVFPETREAIRRCLRPTVSILTPGTPFYESHGLEHCWMTVTEDFFSLSEDKDRHKFDQAEIESCIPGRGPRTKTQGIACASVNDPLYAFWVLTHGKNGRAKVRVAETRVIQAADTGVLTPGDARVISSEIGNRTLLPSPPAGLLL